MTKIHPFKSREQLEKERLAQIEREAAEWVSYFKVGPGSTSPLVSQIDREAARIDREAAEWVRRIEAFERRRRRARRSVWRRIREVFFPTD
jgi:hypothetical protein